MQKQSNTGSQKNTKSSKMSDNEEMESSQLMKLFENELKDIYWAEKALTKAIPKMVKNATSTDLIDALESHLAETQKQVTRLEKVFDSIDKKAVAKKCEAMDGLIKEGQKFRRNVRTVLCVIRPIYSFYIRSYFVLEIK